MRGDSLRDLYAKALALFGLGLLACAGAIVDYWPVSSDVPRVAGSPRRLPALAVTPALTPSERPAPVPAVLTASAASHAGAAVDVVTTRSGEVFLSLAAAEALPLGEPIEFPTPPPVDAPPAPLVALIAERVEAVLPPAREPAPAPAVPALEVAINPPSNGFLTGALKKTGESIVKTGAVTGASIVDAFRGMFGAFKKVSPFAP